MEIGYLDFEMYKQSNGKDEEDNEIIIKGKIILDPSENKLLLYDQENKLLFTLSLFTISLTPTLEKIIQFSFEDNLIIITCDKKDTISFKSFRFLRSKLMEMEVKKNKAQNKKIGENKYIISKPKDYQLEILENCKARNTIVFLETGLGKTYISVLLIKHIFGEPIQNNFNNKTIYQKKSNKKVIFLFKTISLLLQQSKVIKFNTNLKILKLYGGTDGVTPSNKKFRGTLNRYDIICATPETIYRYFTFGYLKIEDINLIVLDECHHTKANDSYNLTLKHFVFSNSVEILENIKILGLTASPSFDKEKTEEKIYENIKNLCNNMNCYLSCPSNILNEYNKEIINNEEKEININYNDDGDKKLEFINLSSFNSSEDEGGELEVKFYIFKEIILPFIYGYLKEKNVSLANNQELSTHETLYLLSLFYTLCADEEKISEKQNGIFEKSDYDLIINDNLLFEEFKNSINNFDLFIEKFKVEMDKMTDRQLDINKEKINFSREIRDINKKIANDGFLKEIKKYVKNVNFIIKYTDIETLHDYSKEIFSLIQSFNTNVCKQHTYKELKIVNDCLEKINLIYSFDLKFKKSKYLLALEDFFSKIISKSDSNNINKSIIFVNQRVVTKLLNEKINKFLQKIKIETDENFSFSSTYVIGCSSKLSIPFNEQELKTNISKFTYDPFCLVLFATNVIEEGIDVPQCNNVINLSEIRTIKEFIQKSGRARKANSCIYLFCNDNEEKETYQLKLEQIKIAIKVMKKIVKENILKPELKKDKYQSGFNYYETQLGARVYVTYAKRLVMEFNTKLFYDGYSFMRAVMKIDDRTIDNSGKTYYVPFLSLPSVLECNFARIFDNKIIHFPSREEAKKYAEKYEDYFYLKAVKLLHLNYYFDDFLMFSKNYDDLLNIENSCSKFNSESKLVIKSSPQVIKEVDEGNIELVAHILDISPNFIDINFDSVDDKENKELIIGVIADSPLTLINFDLFVHSTLLLKLYYLNSHFSINNENIDMKPKIPYTMFTKINISMDRYKVIKINKKELSYVNFFYTYILFFSTDAEMFFYYCLYSKKFDFAVELFKDVIHHLKFIFDDNSHILLNNKIHLKEYQDSHLNYNNHIIKLALLKKDSQENLSFDIDYIKKVVKNVKEDIKYYYEFIQNSVINEEERELLKKDNEFLKEKEIELQNKNYGKDIPKTGMISRNMINFSKNFIVFYGSTDIRGTSKYKKSEMNHQQYFLEKYGVLTESQRDYKKCLPLDYNQKVLRYKVNIGTLGKVHKKYYRSNILKKFQFNPNEILQKINFATIDQLHLFTLFPIILYKVQNSLIYYYQAYMLRHQFPSFKSLNVLDIRLLTSALNAKSTLEQENYERLEFLGDSVLKILASFEVFKIFPDANRDLLFSKRRIIENNKNLYSFALEKNLNEYVYTTPVTLKRVSIPGFAKDETFIFNIGNNRSFAKSCFLNKLIKDIKINEEEKLEAKIDETQDYFIKQQFSDLDIEEKTEKTYMNIDESYLKEAVYKEPEILINNELLEEVLNSKIDVIPNTNCRIIHNKVFADLIESLTGFLLHSSLNVKNCSIGSEGLKNMFDRSSAFLQEMSILKFSFNEIINDPRNFWLEKLNNPLCKFSKDGKYIRVKSIAENGKYKFSNIELLYQAITHPSYLLEESMKANFPYVKKSYQRLAFIGEAFVSFYVSLFVYMNNKDASEGMLHKMKICGINHHVISMIAIDLKLDECLLKNDKDIDMDLKLYKNHVNDARHNCKNESDKFKIKNESVLDENFIIILCELFHAYIGAILLDSKDIEKTFLIVKDIMNDYLINNATSDTYYEHPKVIILDEFMKRKDYFKKIKEK